MRDPLRELRIELCNVLNQSNLGINVKFLILKDIYQEVSSLYQEFLNIPEEKEEEEVVTETIEAEVPFSDNDIEILKKEIEKREKKQQEELD